MADTAAFFANKKKKKKAFKFNANKVDVTSVTQTVHVDAPAVSGGGDGTANLTSNSTGAADLASVPASNQQTSSASPASGEQWDDDALAATLSKKAVATTGTLASTELLDMKALDISRSQPDDIAEKLRVEETKAKLAAAREGMEREAQRRKEEEDSKKMTVVSSGSRFSAAAAGMGAGGGTYVPRHRQMGSAGMMGASRMGGGSYQPKVDTKDENLFPDLAAADAIIEKQKQQQQPAFSAKKTPVGGGATWGSRPKIKLNPVKKSEPEPAPAPEPEPEPAPAPEPEPEPTKTEEPAPAPAPVPVAAAPAPAPLKPKKKKKKDVDSFKK